MPDILHRVGIKSPLGEVYRALTTRQGLASWWTNDTRGSCDAGGTIEFHFGTRGQFSMKVLEADPSGQVLWQVITGPEDWVGTRIGFNLQQEGEQTTVLFKHTGWKEPSEFMHHCSTKWATFLMSLKSFIESGHGSPFPDDLRITVNWD